MPSFHITFNTSPGVAKRLSLPTVRRRLKSRIDIVQTYTAEVARAMPVLCHNRAKIESKMALAVTLKMVTYTSTRVLPRALNAFDVMKPIDIGVKPSVKPISVLAVRLVFSAEKAPR